MEYERVLEDPCLKIGCDEADLFEDNGITDSQLLCYTDAPTQEDNPEGPDQSPEVEEIPPPEPIDGIESQQPAPSSVEEIPQGQGDSKEVEQGSL